MTTAAGTDPDAIHLRFRDPAAPGEGGEVVLSGDRQTLRFVPFPRVQNELKRAAGAADVAALKWGASLLIGLAAIGAVANLRDRRGAGYVAFAAAGLVGVGGWSVRRMIRDLPDWLLGPLPPAQVTVGRDALTEVLTIAVVGGGPRKITLTLGPGEYDPDEAQAFLRAFAHAKNE